MFGCIFCFAVYESFQSSKIFPLIEINGSHFCNYGEAVVNACFVQHVVADCSSHLCKCLHVALFLFSLSWRTLNCSFINARYINKWC